MTINIFIKTNMAQNQKIEIFLSIQNQETIGQINIVIDCKEPKTHIISHLLCGSVFSNISD